MEELHISAVNGVIGKTKIRMLEEEALDSVKDVDFLSKE